MERIIRLVAGSLILTSLALSQLHSRWWLLLTAFVGLNLFQSALTRWCLLEDILRKFGVPPCQHDGAAAGSPAPDRAH